MKFLLRNIYRLRGLVRVRENQYSNKMLTWKVKWMDTRNNHNSFNQCKIWESSSITCTQTGNGESYSLCSEWISRSYCSHLSPSPLHIYTVHPCNASAKREKRLRPNTQKEIISFGARRPWRHQLKQNIDDPFRNTFMHYKARLKDHHHISKR